MENPVTPLRRKISARYNDGEEQHHHKDAELLYWQIYYDASDYVISGIKDWFDQSDFKLYSHMPNLLVKAANGQKYLQEYNIICKIYKDGLDAFSLQVQLKLLPEFLRGSNLSLSKLINSFRVLPHRNNQS